MRKYAITKEQAELYHHALELAMNSVGTIRTNPKATPEEYEASSNLLSKFAKQSAQLYHELINGTFAEGGE